jgi:hypothetical protein
LESFKEVTGEPRQIAGLYFYQLLDCLIDLAYQVSADFYARPQLYRRLGEPTPAALARLNAKYGTEVDFFSTDQRKAIYLPIFGSWEGSPTGNGSFGPLRDALIATAKAFAERASDTGIDALRASVVTAHRPFKDYLVALHGDSVRFSKDVNLAELTEKNAYPILRDLGVAAVFGVTRPHPATEYPYATDPEADVLVEQISTSLSAAGGRMPYMGGAMPNMGGAMPDTAGAMPNMAGSMPNMAGAMPNMAGAMPYTRQRISDIQRAALRGAEAIAFAIDFEEAREEASDGRLDALITHVYTWATALDAMNGAALALQQYGSQAATPASMFLRAFSQSPTSTKPPVASS